MNKVTLTPLLIEELGLSKEWTVLEAYKKWWYPDVSDTNYRLTAAGMQALKLANSYEFDFKFRHTPAELKMLSNLETIYFLDAWQGRSIIRIHIFSEKVAVMIKLYGSFQKYLENIQPK